MHSHFFSKKFQHICVSLDVNFNESLTNDIVSFEQLGPDTYAFMLLDNQMPSLSASLYQIQNICKIDGSLFIYLFNEKKKALWHKLHILNCLKTF